MKKRIYILHGWTYSLDKWNKFAVFLKKSGYEPLFLRIPGLTAKSDEVWDLDKYSRWLKTKLNKEKGSVMLLGHSNGGRIATYYASRNPKRISELILVDVAGIYHNEFPLRAKRFFYRTVARVGKSFAVPLGLRKLLYKFAGERDYLEATPNMRETMVNLINFDLTPIFKKLAVPALIIWGREDRITPLSDAFKIKDLIRNSRLEIVDNASHSPFYSHPEKVAEIIKHGI